MAALRILVVLTLPLGLLGACSDDDDAASGGSLSTSSSTSSSATAGPEETQSTGASEAGRDRAADQALADSIVLTLADVGPGWERIEDDEEEDDEEDAEIDQALADCLQVDPALFAEEADDIGADATFDQEQARLEGSADVAADDAEATGYFDVVQSDRFADCYGGLLDDELRTEAAGDQEAQDAGVTYQGVEMSQHELPAGLGDEAVGYRATIAIDAGGIPLSSYQDLIFVRRGRVLMSISALRNFEAFPPGYPIGLASTMDSRAVRT